MKIISKTLKLLPVFLLVLGLTACSDDDDNNTGPGVQTTTVVDVALENGLTSLAAALEATDLVTTLQGTGPFTVFAPTNAAFDDLLSATGLDLNNLTTEQEDVVRNILLNHVIIGSTVSSTDLVSAGSGYNKTAATGPNGENLSIYFTTSNGVMLNGMSTVTDPDNTATNGTLHIVDTVIDLPTIATFATTNAALGNLVSALQLADTGTPTVPYIETVSDPTAGPFTVFAPTNDAFADLLLELDPTGSTALGDLDPATVDAVLLMHIVNANVQSSGLPSGSVSTLGGDITADNTNFTLTDPNGRVSNIVISLVDIQGMNGVVHVIDKVILPEQPESNTIIDVALDNGLTSLAAALEATGLVSTLQGEGPFTVFAPTNEAFADLLNATGLDLNNLSTAEEDLVRNILLNHVIVGQTLNASDLISAGSGYDNTAAVGPNGENLSIYFTTSNGVVLNGQSTVTGADNNADNGTIHIVDTVIDLPTIATFATTNDALSNLVAALQLADTGTPTVPYIETVSDATAGPFTVFAPTNDAFAALLLELDPTGNTALGDLDPATVDAVLLMHIVNANVQSSGLPNGTVGTLGGDITADNTAFTLTDPNGRISNIITSLVDIQTMNGVVHVIDTVILPLQ
jgi:uncharacterized surface protein with fasciclin (FAS1) repeats